MRPELGDCVEQHIAHCRGRPEIGEGCEVFEREAGACEVAYWAGAGGVKGVRGEFEEGVVVERH